MLGYFGALVIATRGTCSVCSSTAPRRHAGMVSTLIWAGYWILNTRNQGGSRRQPAAGFLISLPFIIVATWFALADFAMTAWQGWAGAIYVGLFEMGFGFVLWLMALRHATNTAPISNLIFISPFASLVLLNLLIGETIHPATPIGLALIVAAPADPATPKWQALPQGERHRGA